MCLIVPKPLVADYEVIEYINIKALARLNQLFSGTHIFRGWGWVAAGMVMDDNNRRRIARYRCPKDLCRTHHRHIHAALINPFYMNDMVLRIK